MVLQSAPVNDIDPDTGSATHTPSEIREVTSILVEQITVISKRERQSLEDMRDIAVNVLINSSIGLGKQLVSSSTPTLNDVNLYPESNGIMFVLECIRKTVYKGTKSFIASGGLVGTGTRAMRNGDVLIGYEKERLSFVIRLVHDELLELIGKASVPRLGSMQSVVDHGESFVIGLC